MIFFDRIQGDENAGNVFLVDDAEGKSYPIPLDCSVYAMPSTEPGSGKLAYIVHIQPGASNPATVCYALRKEFSEKQPADAYVEDALRMLRESNPDY